MNRQQWNEFIIDNKGNFLQSWQWGEFQQSLGRQIWRIEIEEQLKGLVVKYNLPRGKSYLYCPRGPLFVLASQPLKSGQKQNLAGKRSNEIIQKFIDEIKIIAKKEKAIFFRMDPMVELDLEKFGFKKAPPDYYFSATATSPAGALLKIDFSEEELLQKMKPKTRYNLRLAERKGVRVTRGGSDLLDIFYDLLEQTAKREKFRPHLKEHYQRLLTAFGDRINPAPIASSNRGGIKIFLAQYQEQPLAASMVLFFGQIAHYLHGASVSEKRYLMPTYLLHWQAIKEAQKLNCQFYDFGGVAPTDDSNHPWSGLDRFKMGFGAKRVIYPWAQDLVWQPLWYQVYNLIRRIL